MPRLLLVSYYFPPLAGPGVFRPLRLAKYLPRHGWDVTVITVTPRVRLLKDPGLTGEVPAGVDVRRTPTLEPRTLFLALNRVGLRGLAARLQRLAMVPDEQRGWVAFAVRAAHRALAERRHDVVLTTSAPYSAHLVGRALRRAGGPPWIAEFRDEWTTNPYLLSSFPGAWHRQYHVRLERDVLRTADMVVAVSDPWRDALHGQVPELPAERFVTLENGYDGEHFPTSPPPPPVDRFRVVYTGMFYGHRSPDSFLAAVDRIVAGGAIPAGDLEVALVGHTGWDGDTAPVGLPGCVRVIRQQPYAEAQRFVRDAAVLLLVVPHAGGPGNHTGKLFNYLASGRPILCLAPEPNVAADLVRSSRSGLVVPPGDPAAIAAALVTLHADWKAGRGLPDQDRSVIEPFDMRHQVRRFIDLFERVAARRRATALR